MFILQSGTPFIYQGQEIGMTNIDLERLDQFKDVVTFNNYRLAKKLGLSEKFFVKYANRRSRENARTPMQWSGKRNGGFCDTEPWFSINPNHTEINVEAAEADPNSILHWYRALLAFRKENPVAIYGKYQEHYKSSRSLYAYSSEHEGKRLLFVGSFSDKPQQFSAPAGFDLRKGKQVFGNYATPAAQSNTFITKPWECRVYLWG